VSQGKSAAAARPYTGERNAEPIVSVVVREVPNDCLLGGL